MTLRRNEDHPKDSAEKKREVFMNGRGGALGLDLLWTYMGLRAEFLMLKLVLSD